MESPSEDLPVRARVEFQLLLALGNRQRQIVTQDTSQDQPGRVGIRDPVIVGKNHVVRLRAGVDCGKPEGTHGRPLERSIQRLTQAFRDDALGIVAAGKHLDFGLDIGFMPERLAVCREVGNPQPLAAKRAFDGCNKVARAKRSSNLADMGRVVRMEAAPLQHHFLKRIELSAYWRRLANHRYPQSLTCEPIRDP